MNNNTCKYCSKDLNTNDKRRKYCNDECRKKQRRDEWRELNPGWNKMVTITCNQCGKEHEVPPRTAHQAKYCSKECQQTHYSRTVRGYGSIHERRKEWEKQRLIRQRELEHKRAMKSLAFTIKLIQDNKEEEQR